MASEKLSEGDTVTMAGKITRVNDDGAVTVHLHSYDIPVTTRDERRSSDYASSPTLPCRRMPLVPASIKWGGLELYHSAIRVQVMQIVFDCCE